MASDLTVQTIRGPGSGANANKVIVPSGQTLTLEDKLAYDNLPVGSVLQVVKFNSDTKFATSAAETNVNLTDYQISITPKYSNSLVIVDYYVPLNHTSGGGGNCVMWIAATKSTDNGSSWSKETISSAGGSGSAESRARGVGHAFRKLNGYDTNDNQAEHLKAFDFPGSTSQVRYSLQYRQEASNSGTIVFGRSNSNNSAWGFSGQIHITAMEIKQ